MELPDTTNSSGAVDERVRSSRARSSGRAVLIGDIPVGLRWDSEAHGTALSSYTSGWQTTDAAPRVHLRFGLDHPVTPDRDPDRSVNGLHVWWSGDVVHLADDLGLVGVAEADQITIGGEPDARKSLDRVAAFVVGWAMTFHDRDIVHAAALLLPTGDSVVAFGGTGAGKSTLVGIALHHGWQVLSDDLIVVNHGAGAARVAGVPRTVALPPETAAHVGADLEPLKNDGRRARLAVSRSQLTQGYHAIAGVLLIRHGSEAASTLTRISERETFDVILGSRILSSTPKVVRRWLPRAAALSRLPSFALDHGNDAALRVSSGRDRLDDLARSLAPDARASA